MLNLTDPRTIQNLMKKHSVRFSKGLGQNFIVDPDVCPEIVLQGGAGPEVGVLEIGPGIGVLTAQLARHCQKVAAVEIDRSLLPVLEETLADYDNVTIIQGDVLKLDLHALIQQEFAGMEVVVCANLPYYITSPIIMHLLESRLPVKAVTVMVQKEAAQRLCAPMPSRQSGAVTGAVRYYSEPRQVMEVPKEAFLPAPKVDSAVIRLDIRQAPPVIVEDEALLFRVVRGAFSQRRKTLLNCLSAFFSMDKGTLSEILQGIGVSPTIRAEQLSMDDFASITNALYKQK